MDTELKNELKEIRANSVATLIQVTKINGQVARNKADISKNEKRVALIWKYIGAIILTIFAGFATFLFGKM